MRRFLPELIAFPMVLVGLGALFLVLFAGHAGAAAWLALGAAAAAAGVALAWKATRRPHRTREFDGGAEPLDDGVRRVLLVADGSCGAACLEELAAEDGETDVLVVAPALSSRLDRWTADEHAYARATDRLESTVAALRGLGLQAAGHVGSHDPLLAADDGLREFPADEVVFALGGPAGTGWLEQGVVETARQRYGRAVRELTPSAQALRP